MIGLREKHVSEIVLVSEAEMFSAARSLWFEFGIASDLSGAAAVAAQRSNKLVPPKRSDACTSVRGAGQDGIAVA